MPQDGPIGGGICLNDDDEEAGFGFQRIWNVGAYRMEGGFIRWVDLMAGVMFYFASHSKTHLLFLPSDICTHLHTQHVHTTLIYISVFLKRRESCSFFLLARKREGGSFSFWRWGMEGE